MCVVCGMGLMWSIATALRSSIISVFVQLSPSGWPASLGSSLDILWWLIMSPFVKNYVAQPHGSIPNMEAYYKWD